MADLEKLRRNLESHGFGYRYFETPEEAADYLCASLHGRTVGIGGSITVEELGVYPRLAEDNQVFWHWKQDPAQARAQAGAAEVYLCSANGVSETGEIVNIDGTGNRLAASMYGKKKVYIIIGVNKVEPTLEQAIRRARDVAAPLNCRRFGLQTPCALAEEPRCFDCSHPQRICKGLLVFWRKMNGVDECEVVLINRKLGY